MDPQSLSKQNFLSYAPLAQSVACDHLELLRDLPLVLCAVLLREIIDFDTRFPRERETIEARLAYLASLSREERHQLTKGFEELHLSDELLGSNWVDAPQRFEEDLSAYLWASKQYEMFRTTATEFAEEVNRSIPAAKDRPRPWVVVVFGPELQKDAYPLFRKLRPHGTFFPKVIEEDGVAAIREHLTERAANIDIPYGHWYIDGGKLEGDLSDRICQVSWDGSNSLRAEVLEKVETIVNSGGGGPEMLRSAMATWTPSTHQSTGGDQLVDRFVLSVYTEGSGTQVFSTTFVQWATREILRRAEPVSVVVRYGSRQKQRTLNEMFSKQTSQVSQDPAGSLVDADFGAYSTWVNLGRIAGSEQARFIAWSQAHGQAVVIGPDYPRGTESTEPEKISRLVRS